MKEEKNTDRDVNPIFTFTQIQKAKICVEYSPCFASTRKKSAHPKKPNLKKGLNIENLVLLKSKIRKESFTQSFLKEMGHRDKNT